MTDQTRGLRTIAVDVLIRTDNPGWGTLSGLAAHPTDPARLYAVTDFDSPPPRIVELDVSLRPARVVQLPALTNWDLNRPLDLEGVATAPGGGFWVVSERIPGEPFFPDVILRLDGTGRVEGSPIELPPAISARMKKKGLEGICLSEADGKQHLVVAFQVPLDGDPDGHTRIGRYDLSTAEWTFWLYPLSRSDANGKFTGLSEIASLGGNRFAVIERDGETGPDAFKRLATFDLMSSQGRPTDGAPDILTKSVVLDLAACLVDSGHDVEPEIEGLTVAADGQVYALTDNDNKRDTLILRLGSASEVFPTRP